MSLLESRALPLPCKSLSPSALRLFCFPAPVFLPSVLQSRLWRSLSSFLQRDTVDVPRAKGNLFCTSSMHHVAASVDSTSRKCETGREGSVHKPSTVRPLSLLHLLQSGNTPLGSGLVTGAFHVSGYGIEQNV